MKSNPLLNALSVSCKAQFISHEIWPQIRHIHLLTNKIDWIGLSVG